MTQTLHSRSAWIAACRFHDLTEAQVLEEVASRVSRAPRHPLVLLDLDSTLYEVGCRSQRIFEEWLADPVSRAHPNVRDALASLRLEHVGYSIGDTFAALGLSLLDPAVDAAAQAIKGFWAPRFFSSQYLMYDRAYPGAADFARKLHGLGAELVYLTGRDEAGMGEGTRACLRRDGFPWGAERTHLLLKARPEILDLAHKTGAADYVRKHGTLIASFENEPPNVVALHDLFPEAMHVFVDTVCSDHGAPACPSLYRIRGFGGTRR